MTGRARVGLLLGVLVIIAAVAAGVYYVWGGVRYCRGDFEATVRQGPNAGLTATGRLVLAVSPGGQVSGELRPFSGAEIPVSGQSSGQAISLVFDLGNGNFIYGSGAAERDLRECKGTMGGAFAGPAPGDLGDWLGTNLVGANRLLLSDPNNPAP